MQTAHVCPTYFKEFVLFFIAGIELLNCLRNTVRDVNIKQENSTRKHTKLLKNHRNISKFE